MNRQNIKLKVKQNNILEDIDQTIFSGIGQIDLTDDYKIYYKEADKTLVKLKINEKQGVLTRDGEVLTTINFHLSQIDQCEVSTSVGSIFMDVKTLKIEINKNTVFIHYELLEAGAIVGRFQLRMEWENE